MLPSLLQDMALQYGSVLAAEGRAAVSRELGRFVPMTRLRYYFAVDTRYVLKKLLLLVFPFTHKVNSIPYEMLRAALCAYWTYFKMRVIITVSFHQFPEDALQQVLT